MVAKVGSLVADLGLNTAKFEAGIKKSQKLTTRFTKSASKQFRALRKSVNNLGGQFARLGTMIAAIIGPAALVAMTKRSLEVVDAQAKLADTLGISIKALAGFELAGQRTGATAEQVKKSLEKLAVNVSDAATGIGTAKDAFDKLGLSGQHLIKLPLDEQFKLIADRMKAVENSTVKVGIAYDIFGRQGTNMIKLLELTSDELDGFADRAEKIGTAISRIDASKIEAANDAMLEASMAAAAFGNIIAVKVSPILVRLAEDYTEATVQANGHRDAVTSGMNAIISSVGFALDTLNGVSIAWKTAEVAVRAYVAGAMLAATAGDRAFKALFEQILQKGVKFEDTSVGKFVQLYVDAVKDAKGELDTLLAAPPPSEGLKQWISDAVEQSDKLAESINKPIEEITALGQPGIWVPLYAKIDLLGLKFENVFGKIDEGVKGMREVFKNNLRKMIQDLIRSKIADFFTSNIAGGGFFSGGVGGVFRKLLGFNRGGSFEVGGRGGTDQNLVAFRATKGETVSITRAGEQSTGGDGSVQIINHNDFRGSSLNIADVEQKINQASKNTRAQIQNDFRRKRI